MKKLLLLTMFIIMLVPSFCFAYVETGKQEYTNLTLEYPLVYLDNKNIQDKINTDIANYVYDFKGKYDNGKFYKGFMKYIVGYEDEKYLSIVMKISYTSGYRGTYQLIGLVYDKNNGNNVPLNNFINFYSTDELNNLVNNYIVPVYNNKGQRLSVPRKINYISQNYALLKDGIIVLIYPIETLGCNADGVTNIQFSPKEIDYLIDYTIIIRSDIMKKLFSIILLSFLLIPNLCFANYFDQYPEKYCVYFKDSQYKSYLDFNSIKVRRYDPPFYTIDVTTYTFDYINQIGTIRENRYFYDYDNQSISWQILNIGTCDEMGNINIQYRQEPLLNELIPIEKLSPGHFLSEIIFLKCYNMCFDKKLQASYQNLQSRNTK